MSAVPRKEDTLVSAGPRGRNGHRAAGAGSRRPERCTFLTLGPGHTISSKPLAVAPVLSGPFFGFTSFGPDFMNAHSVLPVFVVNAWKTPER